MYVYSIFFTTCNEDATHGGAQLHQELKDGITFLRYFDLECTHIIFKEDSWYSMRSLVVVNWPLMIFHAILVSLGCTQQRADVRRNNFHKILIQHHV